MMLNKWNYLYGWNISKWKIKEEPEKKRDRETSSTLLNHLNYACSARHTHIMPSDKRCMSFCPSVLCCGMPSCKWIKHLYEMEFRNINDVNTFSRTSNMNAKAVTDDAISEMHVETTQWQKERVRNRRKLKWSVKTESTSDKNIT